MNEVTRIKILSKINDFITAGKAGLDSWKDDRNAADGVWDCVYQSSSTPKRTFYYPKVYGLLRHYVRAIRRTYMSSDELIEVTPEYNISNINTVKVCEYSKKVLNYHLHRWGDILSLVDDVATQGLKYGGLIGSVSWVKRTEMQEVSQSPPVFDTDEDGNIVEIKTQREVVKENYAKIDYVPIEDLYYDTTARRWSDVRWVLQDNIEKTEDELFAMVESDGWSESAVRALVDSTPTGETKHNTRTAGNIRYTAQQPQDPEEVRKFNLVKFWGYMALPKDNKNPDSPLKTTFVHVIADRNAKFILFGPTEDVYRYNDGDPMIPFEVGYFDRREGDIIGESPTLKCKYLQAETNAIRNQRRQSVQNDLLERYMIDENANVSIEELGGSEQGQMIKVSDMQNSVREITHKDSTASSYGELEAVQRDLEEQLGVGSAVLGIADPALADTFGGLQLMSNSANTVIYDKILSFNDWFERILTKVLHICLQYSTDEDFEKADVVFEDGMVKEDVMQDLKIRVDCGYGATSEAVKLNNYMKQFFLLQQWNQWAVSMGLEPGAKGRLLPLEVLRKTLPYMNGKAIATKLPSIEEVMQNTQEMQEFEAQQQAQNYRGAIEPALENASQQGAEQAAQGMQDAQAQGQQAQQQPQALPGGVF